MITVVSRIESGGHGEDRLMVERLGNRVLIIAADGAGGTGAGAWTAQAVCDAATEMFRGDLNAEGAWDLLLSSIDCWLARCGRGGLSAVVIAEIVEGDVLGASVGDSGAWLVSADRVLDLTAPQKRRPLLGGGSAAPAAFGPVPLKGRLLAATDGLWNYAPRERIASLALGGTLESAAAALVESVRLRSGSLPDDVALALCATGEG